jgi:Dolichyl-phosphate-mannose-protein mannosyltransferase
VKRENNRNIWTRIPTWLALFTLGLSIYLLTLPADLRNNADTVDRLFVTQSLIQRQTTEINLPCTSKSPGDSRLVRGRHGCWYAIYAPGQTVLMIPLYAAGKAVSLVTGLENNFAIAIAVRMLDPILGALVLSFFYLLALEVGYRRRTAILLTLLLAFGSTLWPDVQSGQEQTQVTLAIVAAVYAALRARRAATKREVERWLLGCGVALGLGIFTRYDFVIYAAVVFGFLAWMNGARPWAATRARPYEAPAAASAQRTTHNAQRTTHNAQGATHDAQRTTHNVQRRLLPSLAAVAVGSAPFLLADAAWNTIRLGAPWRVGQSLSAQFGFPIWQGIPNLLVSPGKGLIWYLPLLWLVPFAFGRFRRRAPEVAWLAVLLFVVAVLFYANLIYWHGDPAWGPRYLFPVVPLLVLPLGELLERFALLRPSLRGLLAAVIGLSVLVQLAAVSVDPWRFWYHLIHQRAQMAQVFQWKSTRYNYYWGADASLAPELYQFAAVKDVAQIAFGDKAAFIPVPTKPERALSAAGCPLPKPTAYDRCQGWGVALRPLDTVDSIWLNGRYQWVALSRVPLSVLARVVILGLLAAAAGLSALTLHLQFWRNRGALGQ